MPALYKSVLSTGDGGGSSAAAFYTFIVSEQREYFSELIQNGDQNFIVSTANPIQFVWIDNAVVEE